MPEFDGGTENLEDSAHKAEDLPEGFGNGEADGNQEIEPQSYDGADKAGENGGLSAEENSTDDMLPVENPVPEDENGGVGGETNLTAQTPLEETPVTNSLDGLEEIVKPQEAQNGEEPVQKDETIDDLAHIIEAIIFASDEPLNIGTLKSVLDASHTFGRVHPDMIVSRINALNGKYESDGSGFHIIEIAEGYQFATRKEMAQWVSYLFREKAKRRLSNSALETLAIIAYKQPITKPEIEAIRGVNVDYVLHNLLEKEIVTVVGRAETVGRPLLYGTTQRFLKIFGLKNLEDLPKLREIEEIIKEIRSKGAEESIQLEITALGDQVAIEPMETPGDVQNAPPADLSTESEKTSADQEPEVPNDAKSDDNSTEA